MPIPGKMTIDIDLFYVLYEDRIDPQIQQRALTLLDDAEWQRYRAFKVSHAAEQFLLGRLLAKTAMAEQMGIPPHNCRIALSDNGKPFVAANYPDCHFSIAHCRGAVWVARASRPLGVDVEQSERFVDREMLNEHFFPRTVVDSIADLRDSGQPAWVVRVLPALYWTSMEAIAKLEDTSIFLERSQFDLLLNHKLEYEFARAITLFSLKIDDNRVTTVAVHNPTNSGLRVRFHNIAGAHPEHFAVLAKTRELELAWGNQNEGA